jgi:hypothetical protein
VCCRGSYFEVFYEVEDKIYRLVLLDKHSPVSLTLNCGQLVIIPGVDVSDDLGMVVGEPGTLGLGFLPAEGLDPPADPEKRARGVWIPENVKHLVSILLEDIIDDSGAVSGPAELVAYFSRVGTICWGVGGDMESRTNVWSVEVVWQQTAIDEYILLVGAVLLVVQVGTKEVFHGKTAKIFNFSCGIFGMRSMAYPVAVFHSNRISERSLSNLDLGIFCTFKRCDQFDFLYLQKVVPVNIFSLPRPFRYFGIA